MASGTQYIHSQKYSSTEVKWFAQNTNEEPEGLAFLFPAVNEYLKSEIPGKNVLDIGCGIGNWCYKAAQYGAKSVKGFDIQEEMVQRAKQATSQFSTVSIRVGDVMDMPYDDNTFDVALSLYVTCCLRLKACISHFKELYRVLVPGGKAIVVNFSKPAFEGMFLRYGADRVIVEEKIEKILMNLKTYPSQTEINDALQDLSDVIQVCFTLNESGHLQRVTNIEQMTNGQAVWTTCQIMTFADYFYDEQFIQQQIESAGLMIDTIENYFTEERRIAYNNSNPKVKLDKSITDTPPLLMYHLSKP